MATIVKGFALPRLLSDLLNNPQSTAKFSLATSAIALVGVVLTKSNFNKIISKSSSSEQEHLTTQANRFTLLTYACLVLTVAASLMIIFNSKTTA